MPMRDSFRILAQDELRGFACRSRVVDFMLRYWLSKCTDGALPARKAIDPGELRVILPHVMLVDLSFDPFLARYRLVGTAVVDHTKFDFTHYYADDILFQGADGTDWSDCYRQVALSGRPGFGISHWMPEKSFTQWTEFIICPLLDDAGEIRQCIAAEEYEPLPAHLTDTFRARPLIDETG